MISTRHASRFITGEVKYMGGGMGGGIEKQQHYYTQPGKVAVHQQQMQK